MHRARVLIADDRQAVLDCVRHHLADEFEVVATVLDGQQALDTSLALAPDAVVLDISMPRMNGLEVARRLSSLPTPPGIVFLTAHDDPDFKTAAEDVGASGYVLKRNLLSQLVGALQHALAR